MALCTFSGVCFAICVVLQALFYVSNAGKLQCPINQEWQECPLDNAEGCSPTCDNLYPDPLCDILCKEGCGCKEGYVRKEINGTCLTEDECIGECPINMEISDCPLDNNECSKTCENLDPMGSCPVECRKACACKEGYIRKELDGPCVEEEECRTECPINQEWMTCPTDNAECSPTCENPYPDKSCTVVCKQGCGCKKGFIREKNDGPCVKEEECEVQVIRCPINQVWSQCPADNVEGCSPTCENPDPEIYCKILCEEGCGCKPGYIRSEINGTCVKEEECRRQSCPINQEVSDCPRDNNICSPTCEDLYPNRTCKIECKRGCGCSKGYVRAQLNGKCVPIEQCETKCPINQVFSDCPMDNNGCSPTCKDPEPKYYCRIPCKEGCGCRKDFIRTEVGGKCVPRKYCKGNE